MLIFAGISIAAAFLFGVAASHFIGAAKLSDLQALEDRVILVVKAEIAKLKGSL